MRRMSATELVCASPSQQRLRRSSDSVAAPLQQRCVHHEWSTGQGKTIEQPVGKVCHLLGKNRGTSNSLFSELIFLKSFSLGHSPDWKKKLFGGVKKSCVWVMTHRIVNLLSSKKREALETEKKPGLIIGRLLHCCGWAYRRNTEPPPISPRASVRLLGSSTGLPSLCSHQVIRFLADAPVRSRCFPFAWFLL